MNHLKISILLRFGIFLIALYACVHGLFSAPVEHLAFEDVKDAAKEAMAPNVILMVVDALRADMITSDKYSRNWPNLSTIITNGLALCSTASVASPTVTSPRLKAIATGRIPEFLDIIYNLDASHVKEPSWLQRMVTHKKRLELYGDDTWLKLFPNVFKRFDGTHSFVVTDFHEVDKNVTRHLDSRLAAHNDWDLMILHYLGLDHIGHVQGPQGTAMPEKLREMDNIVGKLVTSMEKSGKDDWLIFLTGDHGMSDQGSHGGGSYFEAKTSLVLISPKFQNFSNACAVNGEVFASLSDQTDVATLLGLVTGDGIPSGSIGVPTTSVLQAFWTEPFPRYTVLLELLEHFRKLTKCFDATCSHDLLVANEIAHLNQLYSEVSAVVHSCSSSSSTNPICDPMYTSIKGVTARIVNLLTAFQKRAILQTNVKLNINVVVFSCLVMIFISLSFLAPSARDIFEICGSDTQPNTNLRLFTYSFLVKFTFIVLLLHLASLTASSLIEEEHQTWYFLTNSSYFLLLVALAFSESRGQPTSNVGGQLKGEAMTCLLLIFCLDRFLLKLLNKTGDKWIHLPDLNDSLESSTLHLLLSQVLAWLVILLLRGIPASPGEFSRKHFGWCTLLTLSGVALSQLTYRVIGLTIDESRNHSFSFTSPLLLARSAFFCISVDFAVSMWMLGPFITRSKVRGASRVLSNSSVLMPSSVGWSELSPVHTVALLASLLGRPTSVVLWAGVLLKERLLSRIFQVQFMSAGGTGSEIRIKMTYLLAMLYWMEGWVTFFQQGNANKFSAVYLAAGYVGLSEHSDVFSTLMVIFYTYAGPIFWQLSLFARYFYHFREVIAPEVHKEWQIHEIGGIHELSLGLLTAITSMSAIVCLIMHSHIFIWTVFAPKLFFMCVQCCIAIPLYLFM